MLLPWVLCSVLAAAVLGLCLKLWLLKKDMAEICAELAERLNTDTNTLVSSSSGDRQVRRLAMELNRQLRQLRSQRRRYLNGDRELKEAVTNISHDLRTPLTAICGYLDLLKDEEKSQDAARYLALIENRVGALKQLTEELFRYSVLSFPGEELRLEPIGLNGALEESLAAFYAVFTQRGITPQVRMPQRQVLCRGNRQALCRVFSNILNNALKYSDGDLTVELLENGTARFTNRAAGLDEVQVGKLFDRFFSVEAGRNSTGLGLAISKALIEQMQGRIDAQYRGGRLSVCVSLPAAQKNE